MIRALAENPVKLIEQGAPHRIHDDESLARYTRVLFRLTKKRETTDAEAETIDLLTFLIEDYEARYRLPQAASLDVLKYLMQQGSLRQQDLRTELGSVSNISMILSGQRNLSLDHACALANRFNLDIKAFLPISTRKSVNRSVATSSPSRAKTERTAPRPARNQTSSLQTV